MSARLPSREPAASEPSSYLVRSSVSTVVILPLWTFGALMAAEAVWRAVRAIPWEPSAAMFISPFIYVTGGLLAAGLFLLIRWVTNSRMSARASVVLASAGSSLVPLLVCSPFLVVAGDAAFALGTLVVAVTVFGVVLLVDRVAVRQQQVVPAL